MFMVLRFADYLRAPAHATPLLQCRSMLSANASLQGTPEAVHQLQSMKTQTWRALRALVSGLKRSANIK